MDDHVQGFSRQDWPADEAKGKLSLPPHDDIALSISYVTAQSLREDLRYLRKESCSHHISRPSDSEAFHWQDALLKAREQQSSYRKCPCKWALGG